MCECRGALVVAAEVFVVSTALRRGARPAPDPEVAQLCAHLQRLRAVVSRAPDLRPLDPNLYFGPFLAVIRSDKTAAPVTGLALAAVNKFLSYGLMDPTHPSVPATVENIADAVTHARFVGTDHSSDGVVLMKILQVLRTLMLSPEGAMLTGDSVCEIMLSCFRICFETRLSELLRRNADQCLRDMIQLVFMRLPQFSASVSIDGENLASEALSLKKKSSGKRDKQNIKKDSSTLQDIGKRSVSSISSPIQKTSPSSHIGTSITSYEQHEKTSTVQENMSKIPNSIDDQHPSISDSNLPLEGNKNLPSNSEESNPTSESVIKSPSKKHGRHSSMDLASNDNIFITQLVEKCVIPSENMDELSELPTNENVIDPEIGISNETQPLLLESDNVVVTLDDTENVTSEKPKITSEIKNDEKFDDVEADKDFTNPRGVRFIQYDEQVNLQPYGLACVRELFRFLISLCNPMDPQNSSSMVYLGLCLVETALEVSADQLAKHPSILQLIKDPLCRNLLSLLNSERVSIFALDLQVSFLLFESLRTHLKFQMESFFVKLIEIIVSDNAKNSYELKEITYLSLESISQMWRIPGLCTEIYLNYDCDIYCSNLFEDITKLLSKSIVAAGVNDYHALALDALCTVVESIEKNCRQIKSGGTNFNDTDELIHDDSSVDGRKRYISIDIEDCEETSDDLVIHDISQYITSNKLCRHKISNDLPTREQLEEIKKRKRWIAIGTEHFNQKPEKGIEYLQEHGILTTPLDPLEIAHFLRNNPGLDKKMIGEYISKKKNVESRILATYAASFDMTGLRVDQSLRLYLETFRLPGEAPLIFLVMEHFAEHWHKCNGNPFANTDAAFRLAYAIIMLNMDQHNHNAKKLNIPMTIEDFVKNLRGCNGNNDFDQKMLEAVFTSIKNEEIVMPAERTGLVKENYLWKVLLRRGSTKEGVYYHCPVGAYDVDLFMLTWGPMVAALSSIFEKSLESSLYSQALEGFDKCASIVGHFSLTNELDTLILSLCKFTGLFNLPEQAQYIYIGVSLGQSPKAQLALKKVFNVCHRHANSIREGWKHILEVVLALFKGHLLPKSLNEADDFCSPSGKISLIQEPSQQTKIQETGLFSSLYSYIALSSESNAMRNPNPEEAELIQIASECVQQCSIDTMLLTDSKFLQIDSLQELVKYLIAAGKVGEAQTIYKASYTDDTTVFFLELLIKIVIQNRDRVSHIWQGTETYVTDLMRSAAAATQLTLTEKMANNAGEKFSPGVNSIPSGLLERSAMGLLKLAINLMRSEECASDVLHSLNSFLDLSYPVYHYIASQIAIGLFELVKTSAQNIHSANDWALVFTLLETTGAGAMHLKQDECLAGSKSDGAVSSEDDSVSTDRGYTSEGELSHSPPTQGWILVGKNAEGVQNSTPNIKDALSQMEVNPLIHPCALRPHDPYAMLKCWECLAFIVRDVAHITPYNFESCVNCIRTFVEASLHGTNQSKITTMSNILNSKDGKRKKQSSHIKKMQKQNEINEKLVKSSGMNQEKDIPDSYQLISIQLLDLMHTLHSRTAQIFKWWREESNLTGNLNSLEANLPGVEWCNLWHLAWQPLLQGIARLCTDNRRQVSNSAVTYLQRALLVHDLQTLSGEEWETCFHCVLFPLLSRLTKHNDDIRLRANTIMCKVFLHHLTPLLSRPSFPNLWLSLLDLMRSMMTGSNTTDLLYEATLESLKNMLLVMDSVKVFSDGDVYSDLWSLTWDRINSFLPKLKDELFKPIENPKIPASVPHLPEHNTQETVITPTYNHPNVAKNVNVPQQLGKPTNSPTISQASSIIPQQSIMNNNAIPVQNPIFMSNLNQGNTLNQLPSNSQNPLVGNTNMKSSSIILQPPVIGSQVHSPLFSHLGQMVSTPIGVAVPVSSQNAPPIPILYPAPLPQKYCSLTMPENSLAQSSLINSNLLVSPVNMNPNSSQFTLISRNPTDQHMNIDNKQPSVVECEKDLTTKTIGQQPQSLFGEYITNPYNTLPNAKTNASINIPHDDNTNLGASFSFDSLSNTDKNLNYTSLPDVSSHTGFLQKSQSMNSSPLHAANQVNTNFGSSDNIKNISKQDNPDSSGMFSFSKYFYSESTNIPPGSEILFGNTLNQ